VHSVIGFDTLLLSSGHVHTVFFGWELVRVYDENNVIINSVGNNPFLCEWVFDDLYLVAIDDGNILNRPTKTVSEALGDKKKF